MTPAQDAAACMASFCAHLALSGVTDAYVSPGSRSTPLALALWRHPGIAVHVRVDERSAAFAALGAGKVTGRPAVVACTSGTAAANLHPAVVEAHHSGVPLIVATADRPPELQGRGAPQTVEQTHIFGGAVAHYADAGLPGPDGADRDWFAHLACRLVAYATGATGAGAAPVHVNLPFREPLAAPPAVAKVQRARPVVHPASPAEPAPGTIEDLAATVTGAARGLLVLGATTADPSEARRLRDGVVGFAGATGWPVVAEAPSQARFGLPSHVPVIANHDLVARGGSTVQPPRPQAVLRVGAWPVSKPLAAWIGSAVRHVHLCGSGGWSDPMGAVTDVVTADPAATLTALARRVEGRCVAPDAWRAILEQADEVAAAAIADHATAEGRAVASALAGAEATGALLCVSASMPLRDLDTHTPATSLPVCVVANRGANGIDGVLSTAAGAAAASHLPAVAVLGDVAFRHDALALSDAVADHSALAAVVIDNGGGGIFSFLPQAEIVEPRAFDALFGTPPGIDIAGLAAACGASHVTCTPDGVAKAVETIVREGRVGVVVVESERGANAAAHQALWAASAAAFDECALFE